ncbi:MAG: hypothetical protein L0H96_21175 [Humibacillus sp.]|nr:hypothetical protein [Humibacillus sp.]MDN5779410.1 hypothetical protein [Humibacillus sp.]
MMLVDCQTCPVRDLHCADCIVTALTQLPFPTRNESPERHHLGVARSPSSHGSQHRHQNEPPTRSPLDEPDVVPLDRSERRAVAILAAVGLVEHEAANAAMAVVDTGRRSASVTAAETHRRAI